MVRPWPPTVAPPRPRRVCRSQYQGPPVGGLKVSACSGDKSFNSAETFAFNAALANSGVEILHQRNAPSRLTGHLEQSATTRSVCRSENDPHRAVVIAICGPP